MEKLNIAIVGATGLVGRKIIEVLEEKRVFANYFLFAGEEKQEKISILGTPYETAPLCEESLKGLSFDFAFFAVETEIARKYAPLFVEKGAFVIDNSNAFRREEGVPLIAAGVNFQALNESKLISNPNCSTIQLVQVLKPLNDLFKVKRVIVSTYQAVSGAGSKGISDLLEDKAEKFAYKIKNNLIPQIDIFLENGYTLEEDKLIFETRKILGESNLKISATAVRVPVLNGHSESVNIELEKNAALDEIKNALEKQGVVIVDNPKENEYPMPLYASGKDEVFVGRIRRDESKPNSFNLFIVADNLRRGAATNAVEIFLFLREKMKNLP